jgi:hypothetical protein
MTEKAAREAPGADAEKTPAEQAAAERVAASADQAGEARPGEDEAKPDLDDVKRKFRAALDAKRQSHTEGSAAAGRDAGRVHGARGPAGGRRSFRRKSG